MTDEEKKKVRDRLIELGRADGWLMSVILEVMREPAEPHGLRDDFAKTAMHAYMVDTGWTNDHAKNTANLSYQMADLMMKERGSGVRASVIEQCASLANKWAENRGLYGFDAFAKELRELK